MEKYVVYVIDLLDGEVYEVYGKKIVNAAGPWVDTLREKITRKRKSTSVIKRCSLSN